MLYNQEDFDPAEGRKKSGQLKICTLASVCAALCVHISMLRSRTIEQI